MAQEELILKGTYRGSVKCTYGIVNDEKGQPIFTFPKKANNFGAQVVAKDIRMVGLIPTLLTPEARQSFLSLCEEYGWYLSADGTLQEIPNYMNDIYAANEKQHIERLYIDEQGELRKEVIEPGYYLSEMDKRQLKRMYGAMHTKFYPKAVQLLPYISGELPVYVRPTNFRWEEAEDLETDETETESKENSTKNNKVLGLLLAAATFLLSK